MALINACSSEEEIFNTGVECGDAMDTTYLLLLVPKSDKWTDADIDAAGSFTDLANSRISDVPSKRWLPIGGADTEIGDITEANIADVTETLPNGVQYLIRRGQFGRTFVIAKGGLCFAKALFGNNWSKYGFVEIDKSGKVLQMKNADGSYSGIPLSNAYAPLPSLATFTTVYKNNFFISFDSLYYVQKSVVLKGDRTEDVTGLKGLLDVEITEVSRSYTGGTAPTTGATTITALGANGDTIQISINGVDVSGVVVKTASESTITLLAAKVAAAITALAATNGGITASNTVGAITFTVPALYGASLNGVSPVATIVGAITATEAAFTGGADGSIALVADVTTECAGTDLIDQYGVDLVKAANFVIKKGTVVVTPTSVVINGNGKAVLTWVGGAGTYTVENAAPSVLYTSLMAGYDGAAGELTVVVPA
jgi:hypothetical protein